MNDEIAKQEIIDNEHLKLLSIFYYVSGGATAFFALFPLIYVFLGLMFVVMPFDMAADGDAPPAFIGWMFVIIGSLVSIALAALAFLKIYAGRSIAKRKRRTFCFVVAVISCLGIPYGTLLGVFTFIVLSRKSVATLFESAQG